MERSLDAGRAIRRIGADFRQIGLDIPANFEEFPAGVSPVAGPRVISDVGLVSAA